MRKPVFGVFDLVPHKPGYTAQRDCTIYEESRDLYGNVDIFIAGIKKFFFLSFYKTI